MPPDLAFACVPDLAITLQEGLNSFHTVELIEGVVGLQHGLKGSSAESPNSVAMQVKHRERAVPLQCRCKVTTTVVPDVVARQAEYPECVPLQRRRKGTATASPNVGGVQVQGLECVVSLQCQCKIMTPVSPNVVSLKVEHHKRCVLLQGRRKVTTPFSRKVVDAVVDAQVHRRERCVERQSCCQLARPNTEDGTLTSVSCGSLASRRASSSASLLSQWILLGVFLLGHARQPVALQLGPKGRQVLARPASILTEPLVPIGARE